MARFEIVSKYENKNIKLPIRKTKYSAGYDFEVAEDTLIYPYNIIINKLSDKIQEAQREVSLRAKIEYGDIFNDYQNNDYKMTLSNMAALTKKSKIKPTLVPTGIKAQLADNQYLELSVRSSCPLKNWLILANGVGIIDADYYNNPDNEGEIFFQIINLSPFPILLKKGDAIGQGIIKHYDVVEGDEADGVRVSGFGSTDE